MVGPPCWHNLADTEALASFTFSTGVCGVISFGQMLKIQPGVHLRCRDVGMSQQLLYGAQIAAGLQHMAGKRVPQHVRMHRGGLTRQKAAPLESLGDTSRCQPCAMALSLIHI